MTTLRAKEPFSFNDINGVPRNVSSGELFDSADRNVKGREHLFEAVEVDIDRRRKATAGVEDATAEPGEKRSVSTAPKKAAPPKVEPKPEGKTEV